jgi:hypothetical protein
VGKPVATPGMEEPVSVPVAAAIMRASTVCVGRSVGLDWGVDVAGTVAVAVKVGELVDVKVAVGEGVSVKVAVAVGVSVEVLVGLVVGEEV